MAESKTEPAYALPRSKRPWWAYALVSGLGAGVSIAAALGLSTTPARGQEPRLATSSLASVQQTDAEWRVRMEQKLDEALQRIAHIEGRLDRK